MALKLPIYFDYHATTPVDPHVIETMMPYFNEVFGNAASKTHSFGHQAQVSVEHSRETIASALNADSKEIIFTSGATEAINMAIKGVSRNDENKGNHFITVATEHNAVLDCFAQMEQCGADITILPVDSFGRASIESIRNAIRENTVLVSVMVANNEIGTIQPIREIGKICHEKEVLFLTDATQALGKVPLDVQDMNIDLLACSAHKIYGPKGVGALYKRSRNPRVKLSPLMHGGGHERGQRSGTLNVPGIVGFARAVEIAVDEMEEEQERIQKLRDYLQHLLTTAFKSAIVNGDQEHRLAGNLNISFPGIASEALMISVKEDLAVSTGSACTSEEIIPSHVLKALGASDNHIYSSIRFGIGRYNTPEEIEYASHCILIGARVLMRLATASKSV